jgi:hypothetical protein
MALAPLYFPAGHEVHDAAPVAPIEPVNLPSSHGAQLLLAGPEYLPVVQMLHDHWASAGWKLPGTHAWQWRVVDDAVVLLPKRPGAHELHSV